VLVGHLVYDFIVIVFYFALARYEFNSDHHVDGNS